MDKTWVWLCLGVMLAAGASWGAEAKTDEEEVARLHRYYPHGFHFVDTIRPDGKIVWTTKEVVQDKVKAETHEFASLDEFKKAFTKAKVNKKASVEVHLRDSKLEGAYERAEAILKFLRAEGYEKAGPVSN
jgi:hypothetical protein